MPDLQDWGQAPEEGNTNWTGLLGQLQDGTVDAVSTCYVITEERLNNFAQVYPILYIPIGYMYKTEMASADMFQLFSVFSVYVWLLVASMCTVISVLLGANAKLFGDKRQSFLSRASEAFWTVITFITDQCRDITDEFHQKTNSTRLALAALGICCIFFISLYEGGLLSSLLKQEVKIPFRETSGLADQIAAGNY